MGQAGAQGASPPAAPLPRLIIVLGMHRSGTSLCANMLQAMGVNMADEAGASPANRRGHWERPRINDLHDEVLAMFGRRWGDPTHHLALPDGWAEDARLTPIRRALAEFLRPRLAGGGRVGFKDPRISRLLPLWGPVLRELGVAPAYVFCVRDPAQVARSVSARDEFPAEQSAYRWLTYNAHAVMGVGRAPVCVIAYENWFAQPEMLLRQLADFAGLPTPSSQLASIVDADLRHDAPAAAANVPEIAAELHARIAASRFVFAPSLLAFVKVILGCERAVMPFLLDAAILKVSVADQNRVIADLQTLIARLRAND
jgi:hypothetical protein